MKMTKLAACAALIGTLGYGAAAGATTTAVDYTASAAGTPITIGAATSPQYNFVFGQYLGFTGAYSIQANGGATVAFPDNGVAQPKLSEVATNIFGGAVYTDGDYQLDFDIGSTAYAGTATVTNEGTEITSISYDPVGGSVSAAPEPSTWLLMIAGIGGIGLMLRRTKKTMGFRSGDALSRS